MLLKRATDFILIEFNKICLNLLFYYFFIKLLPMSALFLSTYLFINCFRSFNVNYVFNKVNNTESRINILLYNGKKYFNRITVYIDFIYMREL